ncbi:MULTISPECIES: DUF1294 domain-containing protein [Gracilibacillus]|uniref:DUF1294 domain-containing protein n=1 Tax=Gracilibacillus dipsosauri TaxID=178340 RepID=A0A317KXH3_9BACI|nr:DUF1294 domain-containing protein [Gracilibacillus dipsosauri]PWU68197.1 DUF1294 domain-containing protein [Gracilibacillus dipsosauri]
MILVAYYIVMNLIGFWTMQIDKNRAKKNKWRVPERRIWFIAFIGGGIGATVGMNVFRHKTKHLAFKLFLPLLGILQVLLIVYLSFTRVPIP